MPIITRYVLAELMKVFLVALAGMTLFILMFGLVSEAYQEGLGLKQIFHADSLRAARCTSIFCAGDDFIRRVQCVRAAGRRQ